jgi:hypothetical protein
MAKNPEAREYEIKCHKLSCPIRENTLFYARKNLLNTRRTTFFGLGWANKNADNYICENCGHIL